MAHNIKLLAHASVPYTNLMKISFRCNSNYCGADCPDYPPSPYCDNNYCPPAIGTMYQLRKYSHSLPGYQTVCPPFETLSWIPNDIFRNTEGEELGPGAGKCRVYRNPEYYSFHHMTFYDMHLLLRMYRNPSMQTRRKPNMNTFNEI